MATQTKNILALTLILISGFTLACGGGDKAKANKAIEETNTIGMDWLKTMQEGGTKINQLANGNLEVEERQKQESTAKEALSSFDSAKAKASDAAQKMEDASKLNLEDWHKEYMSVQAQMYRKGSEGADSSREIVKAYMDYSIDGEAFSQKFTELGTRMDNLKKEVDALTAKANKIQEDHKAEFKQ
ncbi:MAG: hypothetical protein H0U54_01730 [Acidobacteria bacterium]|nr:hypothetical protein [Acidobacteriota bacterium]